MSQTQKLLSLSEYERFVLMSLYRQAEEENGHPPGAAERKRIRDEYIASPGKNIPQTRPYRKHKKPGSDDRTFHWQPGGPMRTIRQAGKSLFWWCMPAEV
ncbi:DUF3811 domain-containing protein [Salmonella enterica]|nr:DUF3811 domain-containing protein [Salmonella enterica]EDL3528947.1 hypothetical protein [Salmonella enterica subsp. enterica serovar Newport]EDU6133927.1 DUF3811 domain-containing protein [Salmonella enterica subsp. enterica]EBA1891104.1 DUF3811 domain-containing protein [Salmonella enterica]ECL5468745.1 DUF3811 domain-containing protein [Salmonella enterica]